MIKYNQLLLTLFLLFIMNFGINTTTFAQSSKTINAYVEPFFIQWDGQEKLAEHDLITYERNIYVPVIDVLHHTNSYVNISESEISFVKDNMEAKSNNPKLHTPLPKQMINPLNDVLTFNESIHAHAGIVIENSPDNIMFAKNSKEKLYPASTTKIMTALLALEHGNLNELVNVSDEVQKIPHDSSRAHIQPGDLLTLEQLLFAMMVPSGNDAAVAIAAHIAGSEKKFVQMMNEKAIEIGALNTNFVNPHGYHHLNQYTTVNDFAKIAYEASKKSNFLQFVSTPSYSITYKNRHGNTISRTWRATNQQLRSESPYYIANITGGKTGYTNASRHTLVSFATINNHQYIIVILRGERNQRYIDTQRLLNRATALRKSYDDEHMKSITIQQETRPIKINGEELLVEHSPFIFSNRLYVPVEIIKELTRGNVGVTEQLLKVAFNDKLTIYQDEQPKLVNNRIFVPARQTFDTFGVDIVYDKKTQAITGQKDTVKFQLKINSTTALVNGGKVTLAAPPFIENGTSYVPARFVAETFNSHIDWGKGRTLKLQ